ncbi:TRAP-type C4-dicarboxylate transport system, small permease component [Rubellimicrobium thermophilum DSM 16684]|uniref:TRAP transporter small permease protein n=1 Tax=Rubellimicrobium thermophilum DSM 16684 TaxID=1123069 RepID=S9QN50_9RHOB|nr:TRAP transporter small permease subunit [Rubellimicrobium thermophilum]EPX82896.1 TRAP-type C4-dicarboxylate transport system, small permease component [Rubellimicrobium thermophilum DSM 16684]
MLHQIDRILLGLSRIVSATAFVFLTVIAFVDSIGRMLSMPLLGASEYVQLALLVFFFASIALVVEGDAHIRVGLFADLYKGRLARLERYVTGVAECLAMGLLAWMIWDQADRLARFGTLSAYLGIPLAPWLYAAAALSAVGMWFAVRRLWAVHAEMRPRPHAIPDKDA